MILNTSLANYSTASEMASEYRVKTAQIAEHIRSIRELTESLDKTFNMSSKRSHRTPFSLTIAGKYNPSDESIEDILNRYKLNAWEQIIDRVGVRNIMSSAQQEKLNKVLYSNDPDAAKELPDVTEESIMSVVSAYADSAESLLSESIREEYEYFRPHDFQRATLKTNAKNFFKLTNKIIQTYAIEWGCRRPYASQHTYPHLMALDNIFHLLDGRGVTQGHRGHLCDAISSSDGTGETEFFKFRCFRNRNLHLTIKRQDLLNMFNAVAGGMSIGQARKKSSSRESRELVPA